MFNARQMLTARDSPLEMHGDHAPAFLISNGSPIMSEQKQDSFDIICLGWDGWGPMRWEIIDSQLVKVVKIYPHRATLSCF